MTKQEKSTKSAVLCHRCGKLCTGEVLKVQDRHFHTNCFLCAQCHSSLASGGYFFKDDKYFCKKDYQKLYGITCTKCGEYVEGRVVSAKGSTYHPQCFTCDRCKAPISNGAVLTPNGKEMLCHSCGAPKAKTLPPQVNSSLNMLSDQRKSSKSPSGPSPYTFSSSSNASIASSSSNGLASPGSIQGNRHQSPTIVATSSKSKPASTDGSSQDSSWQRTMNFSIGPPSARSAARNSLSGTPPTKRDQTGSPHQRSFSFDVANTTDGPLAKKQQQSSEADRRNIPAYCASCHDPILRGGSSYLALNRYWHMWCLKCKECSKLISDEFAPHNGFPFCIPCYMKLYSTVCAACNKGIVGTGLEADNRCFHPECAKCSKCGEPFGEEDDICILGTTLWHLNCDSELSERYYSSDSRKTSRESLPHSEPEGAPNRSTKVILTPGKFAKKDSFSGVAEAIKLFSTSANEKSSLSNGSATVKRSDSQSSADTQVSVETIKSSGEPTFPLELLQLRSSSDSVLRELDRTKLEQYLSDDDFIRAFGIEKDEFLRLPKWKKLDLKKRASLF